MLPQGWDGDGGGGGSNATPQISLYDINVELKNSPTAQISMNDTRCRLLANRPTGSIAMNNFYNKFYRAIYRPTAYNGTTGANSNAYNPAGISDGYNAEIYPNHTDYGIVSNEIGYFTWSGLPSTSVSGTLRVGAYKVNVDDGGSISPPSSYLPAYIQYSTDGGTNYTDFATLTDTLTDYGVALTCNPNNLKIKGWGTSGSGGSLKLGTDWKGHSILYIYDILFTY